MVTLASEWKAISLSSDNKYVFFYLQVYTINTESNHLLVFGVPSLNLRQEAKALFLKFGNLQQFHVSTEHPGEVFSETYHAKYDRIQSARIAKRMLDTKSFYGGLLHVCYAPELETLQETRLKLLQRGKDVTYRLRNLSKEKCKQQVIEEITVPVSNKIEESCTHGAAIQNEVIEPFEVKEKLNMGAKNIIYAKKRKAFSHVVEKKFKPYIDKSKNIEVIDFTSTERETLSNINEALNYNRFGNEDIRVVAAKAVNRIKFNK